MLNIIRQIQYGGSLGSPTLFLSLKIFSLSMGSSDLGRPGCFQERGSSPRSFWNPTPLENFAKMSGSQFHMIMNWLKFVILFAFCCFILYSTYFYSFISLLRNDLLATDHLKALPLCLVVYWQPPESHHPATLVLFSSPWPHKSPLQWLPHRQLHCLRAQKIRPTRKVMLNAWWQVSSFPDAKYLKCRHSHHGTYFLCHLDSFGCQDEFPNGADVSVTMSWG